MADTLKTTLSDHKRTLAAESLKKGRTVSEWVSPPLDRSPKERADAAQEPAPFDAANLRKVFRGMSTEGRTSTNPVPRYTALLRIVDDR
jgi:hypothetical protein